MGKGLLVEVGKVLELAANYNQGRVQILYIYIGLSLNISISVVEYYQVFCTYTKVNS